ncbi:putative protein kinase RLK-Pelle-L-LEC family [Helianthus annuus]|uniref:Protein kinase domain-containing protein n=1 Tax=Helianthus annuus TaxID=4232 RepID=A0A251V759_HELAN|nr:putative protein kinase RLK-Pelle-L-LEC family [Helianthus annuus]KAJ0592697.1 putative protein kinase RLK-Pelle-L-LEC family [Helianthus annuus]KAJ0600335.1 putative protein kinase RLK-Pelle-L-LEC family [Helianthus annuus]KAJ0607696.1 putative protein kinase RLK-Pelle-L-LEC family [Helianthus annuus]KAJ0767761.1 putative protein kinase RLK-Pelle-L-LEC family [Helianthus annuus]
MSILTIFFLVLIPYTTSISFNFRNISQNNSQDIILSGDAAYIPGDGIQVTYDRNLNRSSPWLAGRATYKTLLHLWDNDSNLASFSRSFTFVISSYVNNYHGDGLTFFLAPNNSVMKAGEAIGLPVIYKSNTSTYPFVAVEFDTYGGNVWDPMDPNSPRPIDEHNNNITLGKECRALINYHADSKNLSVSFTNFKNNSPLWETGLSYTVDLRKVLPEWVIFGFSASTGDRYEKHMVRSWTFNSTKSKVVEYAELAPTTSPNVVKGKNYTMRKVEVIAGTLGLVAVLATAAYFLWRRKKNSGDKVEEHGLALELESELEMGHSMPRRFSYHELAQSTANFAETKKLGEGGFGGVYKGFLKNLSLHVAVKKVSKTSKQGIKQYASEVRLISRLRHKNLVQL